MDDIDDDPELFAFMKQVENDVNNKNSKVPSIKSKNNEWKNIINNTANNGNLSAKDQKLINDTMNEVPEDILKASKKYADKEYKAYKQKEKLYAKMGKMGVDPDDYLNQIMGDSDDDSDDVNDSNVQALINAAKDEAALEMKFGVVNVPKKSQKSGNGGGGKNMKQKQKQQDEDNDEYWDSYADCDTPKKNNNKGKGRRFW